MAEKNRNVNLEEIDADAFLGISALKNQTFGQKVIFWGMVVGGVLENVLAAYLTDIPSIVSVVIFLFMLCIGIAFGCNYTEDMTYGRYLYYFFFKPAKDLPYISTEDMEYIRKAGEEIRKEDEKRLQLERQTDRKEQKKLLIKLIAFVIILLLAVISLFVWKAIGQGHMSHHIVAGLYSSWNRRVL